MAAGAGTGKTSTVVGRILYLLGVPVEGERVAEPLTLRDISAITYTNAAAADLKRKLREELRKAAGETRRTRSTPRASAPSTPSAARSCGSSRSAPAGTPAPACWRRAKRPP